MKQLGTLVLPDSMIWMDKNAWSPVQQSAVVTISGRPVIFHKSIIGGRPITLIAQDEVTWMSDAEVTAINAMAAQPGATFPLIWGVETFTVLFRHHEPPAVSFQPIAPNAPHNTGEIRLMEIH